MIFQPAMLVYQRVTLLSFASFGGMFCTTGIFGLWTHIWLHIESIEPRGIAQFDRGVFVVSKWVSAPKIGGKPPKSSIFNRVFHYKPSILGCFLPIFGNIQIFVDVLNIVYCFKEHTRNLMWH